MADNLELRISKDALNVQIEKTDTNQAKVVIARTGVNLTIANRVRVTDTGGGGISGVIVEDEGVEVGTFTKLNFKGTVVEASEEDPDTAQIVITGDGAGGSLFLPMATYYDDSDETYFYFGFTAVQTEGEWLVRRTNRATLQEEDAQQTNNPALLTLDAAWPLRATLTYA